MILAILLSLCASYFIWSMITLEINYRRACSMNIPVVCTPIDGNNVLWSIIQPHLTSLLKSPPFNRLAFVRYSLRGWHFGEKADAHARYGPIWALVTPVEIMVQVSDSEALKDIYSRRWDFPRPVKMYKLLEVYGPCISTASSQDWARHRKVLATPFNESIMKFVWDESVRQARAMAQSWIAASGSFSVSKDTRSLSLNILAATGFRRSYDFRGSGNTSQEASTSYRDSLQTVLDNIILLLLVPPKFLLHPLLPKSFQKIGKAAADFKKYMETMLEEESASLSEGKAGSGGLMTSFVRGWNTNQLEAKRDADQPTKGLSIEEIFGNIFVINFAGHDTTANTLAFCMLLLATYPEVQAWVGEELRGVSQDILDYEKLFPTLKRCRALLLETLRLFPPIMVQSKWTGDTPSMLRVGDRTIMIPKHVNVFPNILAVQTNPENWDDPLEWRPSRWIITNSGQEELLVPAPCTYLPWADGPQNCPGLRFSQVEFVAVMACLLKEHRVSVALQPSESVVESRKRVLSVVNDCNMELLLRMKDSDRVRLICEKI